MKLPRPMSLLQGRLSRIANSKGTVYYGLHCYPGTAHYRPPGEDPYTVFIGEETLRRMDPTFAGCPVYLDHVDDLPASVDDVRREADGVVVESFFNPADGRHWCKFIALSERAEKAILEGYTLSNCYAPTREGAGGLWTGVAYDVEILDGNYEHLALVQHPRYEDAKILTADQFKQYNAEKDLELKRLANNKDEDTTTMPIKLFRRQPVTKIENAKDLEDVMVALKSGRELTITQLVNWADETETAKAKPQNAMDDMLVNMGDTAQAMTVSDLRNKYNEMCAAVEAVKQNQVTPPPPPVENADDDDDVVVENADDEDDDDDVTLENDEDDDVPPPAKKKNEADPAARARAAASAADKAKADARAAAARLRNASEATAPKVEAPVLRDSVEIGRQRYGSN